MSVCLWLATKVPTEAWIHGNFKLKIDRSVKTPRQEYGYLHTPSYGLQEYQLFPTIFPRFKANVYYELWLVGYRFRKDCDWSIHEVTNLPWFPFSSLTLRHSFSVHRWYCYYSAFLHSLLPHKTRWELPWHVLLVKKKKKRKLEHEFIRTNLEDKKTLYVTL